MVGIDGALIGVFGITQVFSEMDEKDTGYQLHLQLVCLLAILQATNPQNDLVTAFWLICLLFFIFMQSLNRSNSFWRLSLLESFSVWDC